MNDDKDPYEHLRWLVCEVIDRIDAARWMVAKGDMNLAPLNLEHCLLALSELGHSLNSRIFWCPDCHVEGDEPRHRCTDTSSIYVRNGDLDGMCHPKAKGFLCLKCAEARAKRSALPPLDRPLGDPPDKEN